MVTTDDANKIWEAIEGLRKELRDFTAGDGTDDRPGFAIRIDRLEQSAKALANDLPFNGADWRRIPSGGGGIRGGDTQVICSRSTRSTKLDGCWPRPSYRIEPSPA